jgi:choline kinase
MKLPYQENLSVVQKGRKSPDHPIRTAVILAAGMGVRLKERTKLTPKCYLRLGGKTIIEESILRLLDVGIERIVIVTGHLAGQFIPLKARYCGTVELAHNPHFADSGTLYSLYCARQYVDGSFLLLEADLVYEHRALIACLEHPRDNVLLLSGFTNTSDEYFVETRNDRLHAISTNRESLGAEAAGEMVGISKISQSLFALMVDRAVQRFATARHWNYEVDWLVSAAREVPIVCPVVDDLVWCEIDDETQLGHARDNIYPVVSELDKDREMYVSDHHQNPLSKSRSAG